jgi:class 3 adenylate cyclase
MWTQQRDLLVRERPNLLPCGRNSTDQPIVFSQRHSEEGIAQGYATLGQIGFAERSGYTAIGTVCNLAARLCAEAQDGQILIGQRVAVAVEETITLEEVGALALKGLTQPVVAYDVPLAAIQPALRVIEGGPQSV